jgi:pimeloyl-ACP methyl ester carboxylesterase
MSSGGTIAIESMELHVGGAKLFIAATHRSGDLEPIAFLHGFGSAKEDYADIVYNPMFAGRPFVAYDAPGCGESVCCDLSIIAIPVLVDAAIAVLDRLGIEKCHLVGHSMGGLTALVLACQEPSRVLSLVSIEGNLAPEDCFISRQIHEYPADSAEEFLEGLIKRLARSPFYSSQLYAANLRNKVRAGAVRGILSSIVQLSDHSDLLNKFISLPCPKMFMYGDQNAGLSYLRDLEEGGVKLARIAGSGHFPMYSNPVEMWTKIALFLASIVQVKREPANAD